MTTIFRSSLTMLHVISAFAIPAFAAREMLFEANKGQAAPGVQFVARTPACKLLLKPSGATLLFRGAAGALDMKFIGGNPNVELTGLDASPAKANYFSGGETAWLRNISVYQKVRYASLYPGIDLNFYGSAGRLEYDFVVKPEADPRRISIGFDGAVHPSIAANGDLVIAGDSGELRFLAPVVYQSPANRIQGEFVLSGDHTAGFAIGAYDHAKPLVIDPVVTYSSYLGGSDDEGIFGIQRDPEGNIYVAGETSSLNFPTKRPVQPQEGGNYDAFVSKFDPSGTHLIYSTYLGGSGYDHAVGLAVDDFGEVYLAGVTSSSNFPLKNALQTTLKGQQNLFAAHLTQSGSDLVFSTYLGGSQFDNAQDLTIDRERNMYITGETNSTDFPVTAGAFQAVCDGPNGFPFFCIGDAFVTKIAHDGSKLLYSTFVGGRSYDSAGGIKVDGTGAVYITGQTSSPDYPVLNAYQSELKGFQNAFVSKLDQTGSKLEFSTYLGGTGGDGGNSIALGPEGEVYITGTTASTDFPVVKPFQATNHGGFFDCFISKFSKNGKTLLRSSYFGGSGLDYPFKVAVDSFGSAAVIGFTSSTDLLTTDSVQGKYAGGNTDGFVLKLLPESVRPLYSTFLGGSGDEYGYGIYAEDWGGVWFGGSTSSTNFPILEGYQSTYGGGPYDAFLTRLALTFPDYLKIIRDLLECPFVGQDGILCADCQSALCLDTAAAQEDYDAKNTQAARADLERLDEALADRNGSQTIQRALAASKCAKEMLKQER